MVKDEESYSASPIYIKVSGSRVTQLEMYAADVLVIKKIYCVKDGHLRNKRNKSWNLLGTYILDEFL